MTTAAAKAAQQAYATNPDGTEILMRALAWQGKGNVKVQDVHKPAPGHPEGAVIKVTGTSVCGADMRLYNGDILKLKPGDVLGHEAVGIVESVGSNVTTVKPGDRVVACFSIACGQCNTCLAGRYTACEALESPLLQDVLYGQKDPRKIGFSHLFAMTGCQAEFVRIPFADFNLVRVNQTVDVLPDEKLIALADVIPTAYHAVMDSRFEPGGTAVIFGAGPIGLTIAQWLKVLGAKRIIIVDTLPIRLAFARTKLAVETLNVNDHGGHAGTAKKLRELEPTGWTHSYDATGFRYKRNLAHKLMRALSLEHPVPEALNACIEVTRPGGAIEVIGDYVGASTGLDISLLIEKGIALKGIGQTPTQRYLRTILDVYIVPGLFDSTLLLTHRFALEDLPELYRWANNKRQALSKETKESAEAAIAYKAFVQTRSSALPAVGTPSLSRVMDVSK